MIEKDKMRRTMDEMDANEPQSLTCIRIRSNRDNGSLFGTFEFCFKSSRPSNARIFDFYEVAAQASVQQMSGFRDYRPDEPVQNNIADLMESALFRPRL